MNRPLTCPALEQLGPMLNGILPLSDEEAAALEQHLRECSRCEQLAELSGRGDTLIEALAGHDTPPELGGVPGVDRLIERFKNLSQLPEQPTQEVRSADSRVEGDRTLGGVEQLGFLAPAQAAGELGWLRHYRVLRVLGRGGMGVVLLAEDTHLERPVAIKAMLPALAANLSARERFLREARAAARIKHDHVVTIHQVGEQAGLPFLAMELLDGESLDERLTREGRLPLEEVLRIGGELAEGLAAAHESGLIHRDIKPANVWLEGKQRRVKVLDFGLARGSGDAQVTLEGAIVGTPAFMAPEQARGDPVDFRCDLFSLGCVLYRMTTGELPFKGKDALATLHSLAVTQPSPPRQLNAAAPVSLDRLITRLLSKDPAGRPPSAAAVARALRRIEQTPAQAPTSLAKPVRKRPRRLWWVAAALVALLAVGALLSQLIVLIKDRDGKVTQKIPVPVGHSVQVVPGEGGKSPPFFNGKNLDGWEGDGQLWKVEKGMIVGRLPADWPGKFNTFLCSKKTYKDFELRFQVRLRGDKANSGVQIRSQIMNREHFTVKGPQCDMGEDYWGSLYGEHFGGMMEKAPVEVVGKALLPDQFNHYFIRCVGKRVTIKLNGATTVDDDFENLPSEGILAWQLHGRSPGMEVVFRDIRFKELNTTPADEIDVPNTPAPKAAIVLFNGKNLDGWVTREGQKAHWRLIGGGAMVVTSPGDIHTVREFGGSFRLHVEFKTPYMPEKSGQARGNSGVYLQGRYEVQILDSYGLEPRENSCGAIYGVAAPRVNVCKAPRVWQSYDIDFTAPRCKNGAVIEPARMTIYHNGVKIHENVRVARETGMGIEGDLCQPGPILLQQHSSPVQFRNIWLLPVGAERGR